MGSPSGLPLAASHSRAVLSAEAVTTTLTIRTKLRRTNPAFMQHGRADWFAAGAHPTAVAVVTR